MYIKIGRNVNIIMTEIHQREYLCPACTPEIITVLVRFNKEKYYCPRCKTYYHPDNEAIASNYTWLYILEEEEGRK